MDKVECVVIGAGVIGLAVARRLAQAGREVIVLEAAEAIGTVTSSRNSEVIHAGIYYPAGSLMARMCVRGKHALYQYCRDHGVPHRNCGKLIVATTHKETAKLQSIRAYSSQFHSAEYNKNEPQTYISTPEFLHSIIGRHQMFGKMIGVPYAEGFITEKVIGVRDFDAFVQMDT